MKTIKAIPQMVKMSGWNAILPERTPFPALEGQHNFDWVVIGAGYAGLSAARRIAEHNPDQSVALVEAFEIGENASGKMLALQLICHIMQVNRKLKRIRQWRK